MYNKIHSAIPMRNYDSGVIMKMRTEGDSTIEKDLTQIVESLTDFYQKYGQSVAQKPQVRQNPNQPEEKSFAYSIFDYFDRGNYKGNVRVIHKGLDEREFYRKFLLFFNPKNENARDQ